MRTTERDSSASSGGRRGRQKALFICGSVNQTRQLHAISKALPEVEPFFSPYYCDGTVEVMRKMGLCDRTILGWRWRKECLRYLRRNGLAVDHEARRYQSEYELVVTCSDVVVPRNILGKRTVLIQEGITDPERFWYWARCLMPIIPRWASGTAFTGTSNMYDRFCVASEGYRALFARKGADPAKMVVTGIPNFDDCAKYHNNEFPLTDYVLVCTSDARETMKFDNRRRFIKRAVVLAAERNKPLVFKLHPNENWDRATAEIAKWAPGAQVFTRGSAEEMVANSSVLVCQYSTLAFVGLALGKEVHSYFDMDDLRSLLPIQGGGAAIRIADVCRDVLAEPRPATAAFGIESARLGRVL